MRLSRFLVIGVVLAAVAACNDDEITNTTPPPLAGVRFINAMADTGAVDIRMIDQVPWSALALSLAFRSGTEHQPTEAKTRHIRVFPTSRNPVVTSNFMLDTMITFAANQHYTLLLSGSAKNNTDRFIVIADDATSPAAGSIAVRAVNASCGPAGTPNVDFLVGADSTALAAVGSNIAPNAASAYQARAAGSLLGRFTTTVTPTRVAQATGPVAPATPAGARPAAGVNSAGTVLSAYCFPRSVAGTTAPQDTVTFNRAAVVYFVDRVPGGN
jgi:hypothetical protein